MQRVHGRRPPATDLTAVREEGLLFCTGLLPGSNQLDKPTTLIALHWLAPKLRSIKQAQCPVGTR